MSNRPIYKEHTDPIEFDGQTLYPSKCTAGCDGCVAHVEYPSDTNVIEEKCYRLRTEIGCLNIVWVTREDLARRTAVRMFR